MQVSSCENVYTSAACNCYPHCFDLQNGLIVFGSTNSVVIYDLKKRRVVETIARHTDLVNSIRWVHGSDCQYLVSSSVDKSILIWEVNNDRLGVKLKLINGHQDSVIVSDSVATGDGHFITVSSSNDRTLVIWKDAQVSLTQKTNCFIFDVKLYQNLSLIRGLILVSAGSNEMVTLSRFENDQLESLITLRGHEDWIKSVDLVQHNNQILLASGSQDFLVRVYEIKKSTEDVSFHQQSFQLNSGEQFIVNLETVLSSHEGWVTDVKWTRFDEHLYLLTSSMDKTITLWEQMGSDNNSIWNEKIRFGEVGGNVIGFLSCASGSDLIAGQSYSGAIHLWRKEGDNWLPLPPITGHFREVTDLVWEPKGEYFLTCSADQTTRLHSRWVDSNGMTSWHEIARSQVHGYDLKCLAMAGRHRLVSGADEKVVRIFEATRSFIDSVEKISSVCLEVAGDMAQCATVPALGLSNAPIYDSTTVEEQLKPKTLDTPPTEETLLQNTLWSESQKLYGHGYEIFQVAVNSNFTLLASACKASNITHGAIIVWDLKSNKKLGELVSHNLTVTQICFSPNDNFLLSVSRDRTWALFDMTTADYPRVAHSDKTNGVHTRIIWDCAWCPDSKTFFTASRDRMVIDWNVANGNKVTPGQPLLCEDAVTSIHVHPTLSLEQKYLVCIALEIGSIFLYSFDVHQSSWCNLYQFDSFRHTHMVNRVRFSSKIDIQDDKKKCYIASCSCDRSIKLFEITI